MTTVIKATVLLATLLAWTTIYGQQFYPITNFDDNNINGILLDTTDSNNLWQIGKPNKILFDSSYSPLNAILTDSVNTYPNNNTSVFYLNTPHMTSWWPTLTFTYKIDADSLRDFGEIMASYDNGNTWIDVIKDAQSYDIEWWVNGKDLGGGNYETITSYGSDSIPFTGTSDIWYRFHMTMYGWDTYFPINDSIVYRISFYSDSINTNQEGWMIDDIYTNDWLLGIPDNESTSISVTVHPNPYSNLVTFTLDQANTSIEHLAIYNSEGTMIKNGKEGGDMTIVDLSLYPPGIYIYTIITDHGSTYSGKLIKN